MNESIFQKRVEETFRNLKLGKPTPTPAILYAPLINGKKLTIYVVTKKLLSKKKTIELLADWRDKSNIWFPAQFKVTFDGTKKWAKEQLLEKKDRILFFLQVEKENTPFGHIGLYRFNFDEKSCEIDNIIRGIYTEQTKGAMTISLKLLIDWTYKFLGVKNIYLQVVSDNEKAIALYHRLGFKEVSRVPLIEKTENGVVTWVEVGEANKHIAKRFFVKMHLSKE